MAAGGCLLITGRQVLPPEVIRVVPLRVLCSTCTIRSTASYQLEKQLLQGSGGRGRAAA